MRWTLMLFALIAGIAIAELQLLDAPAPDGLRSPGTLSQSLPAPPIAGEPRESPREVRNYPEQPPVIPHSIRNYQVDLRFNSCLDCHTRQTAPAARAPMVSVTHFMDRGGQIRAAVTPSRYFCTQCHVPRTDARPLVENRFLSMDHVIEAEMQRKQDRDQ